jgi:hypothetical protein
MIPKKGNFRSSTSQYQEICCVLKWTKSVTERESHKMQKTLGRRSQKQVRKMFGGERVLCIYMQQRSSPAIKTCKIPH